jgi:hypothetical protein
MGLLEAPPILHLADGNASAVLGPFGSLASFARRRVRGGHLVWRVPAGLGPFAGQIGQLGGLLLTLNNGFTRRAQVFNHNSVLVALMALLDWRLAVALLSGRAKDFIWVGLLAGLGLITKYQALMPM